MTASLETTMVVPCGLCILCLKRRQNAWTFRLTQETQISYSACFLTLTYEETPKSFNGNETLCKADYQKFLKRLRKKLPSAAIKYYACGEYGTQTQRPHYHAIMFNLPQSWVNDGENLASIWKEGHVYVAPCNIATIKYVCKYVMKGRWEPQDELDDRTPEFAIMSKKMGLSHLTPQMVKYYQENQIGHVTLSGGQLTPLPRYFKEKIFTRQERQTMAREANAIREIKWEELFDDAYHEVIWKKDQIRKEEKLRNLERLKL